MDEKNGYALIVREANVFVAPREAELKAAYKREGHLHDYEEAMEAQVRGYLVETADLNALITFSGLKDKDPELWRDASDWDSAVFRVAYACLTHDLFAGVIAVLEGKMPKVPPEQVVVE